MPKSSVGADGPDEFSLAVWDRLGVAESVLERYDTLSLLTSFGSALIASALCPVASGQHFARYASRVATAGWASVVRSVGRDVAGPTAPAPNDRRFSDPMWTGNAAYFGMLQLYLLSRELVRELVDQGTRGSQRNAKALFAADLISDALSPTNFFVTNPAAIRRAVETGGLSVGKGWRNLVDDVIHRRGWPRQVDPAPFTVGENMAATAGKVVFRNDLIELIQFCPRTDRTREIPLLIGPPWINKYYVLDLAPGRSFVEWAVAHELTTFVISYRNPDSSMRDFSFDDYLIKGPRAALDVVRDITGAETVNTASACVGGTLNTALLAYLAATGDKGLVHTATTMNCLVDHHDAGTLSSIFSDETTVARLEKRMEKSGYLDADEMAHSFDLLRANDLIFAYVVSGWLLGERPPAFDLLAWNNDATRMPAKMHSFYLRQCWLENSLATDQMVLDGERLMTSEIDIDSYIVAAVDDHIVPWRSSYRTTQILKSDCRFVLSSAGHIAGIVNPPNPRSRVWINEELPADPDRWLAGAAEYADTWWNDWIDWITPRSGDLREPPSIGGARYPVLADAPGQYVKG